MVILLPMAAHLDAAGSVWEIPIHGWVFETEADSLWRDGLVQGAAAALGLGDEAGENEYFRERAWMFLIDNERGKDLHVAVGGQLVEIGQSGADGHVTGTVSIAQGDISGVERDGWMQIGAVLPAGDQRRFMGAIQLLAPAGVSVISDIDDTIKVSNVTDKQALLANTFLREFRPTSGMAELYRGWAESGAAFHYVSSSPWQLYPALSGFLEREAFPRGSFHLRQFRLKDESFFNLFQSGDQHKIPAIEAILEAFPGRRFFLVGDSGERDPEIYGEIARRFSGRIEHILIRNVSEGEISTGRLDAAFTGIPAGHWTVFRNPAELSGLRIPDSPTR